MGTRENERKSEVQRWRRHVPPTNVNRLAERAVPLVARQVHFLVCHGRLVDEQRGVPTRFDKIVRRRGIGGVPGSAGQSMSSIRGRSGGAVLTQHSSHQNA